jgi:hypothetical protein
MMGLKLQWGVLRSDLPRDLKLLAVVLALIANDDGSGIYVRVKVPAEYLGLTRENVSRQLEDLAALGLLKEDRRGGRSRATQRHLVASVLDRTGLGRLVRDHRGHRRSRNADVTERRGFRNVRATQSHR